MTHRQSLWRTKRHTNDTLIFNDAAQPRHWKIKVWRTEISPKTMCKRNDLTYKELSQNNTNMCIKCSVYEWQIPSIQVGKDTTSPHLEHLFDKKWRRFILQFAMFCFVKGNVLPCKRASTASDAALYQPLKILFRKYWRTFFGWHFVMLPTFFVYFCKAHTYMTRQHIHTIRKTEKIVNLHIGTMFV